MPRRRVAVVSSSRADYSHLFWLLREIEDDPVLELQLIVTGTHLSEIFGRTVTEIEQDGFSVAAEVNVPLGGDRPVDIAHTSAAALDGLSRAFERLKPDVVVVLGDRFETLSAATAALLANIPIAHIHGGEVTEGAIDDAIRHAITKMARIHFAAAEPYARRIVRMGEDPSTVHNVGAPGLDHLGRLSFMTQSELESDLDFCLSGGPLLAITFHPETATLDPAGGIIPLLVALTDFPSARLVFTGVNADTGHDGIAQATRDFIAVNADRAIAVPSLGRRRYLSLLKIADAAVGNSSSGLIEAPALGVPTVNVGMRQEGRLKAWSVIDCPAESRAISAAIARALDPAFRANPDGSSSFYGQGNASRQIKDIVKVTQLANLPPKRFYDQP